MATIAIAIPAGDYCPVPFAYDLARMVAWTSINSNLNILPIVTQGSLTTLQRQSLAKDVLKTDATHVLWLDTDMRFPKETILRLLSHGKPFVAANYSTRRMPVRPVAILDEEGKEYCFTTDEKTGLEQVRAVGLGCALVETAAMRRLEDPMFQTPWSIPSAGFIGEDVYFCRKLEEAGVDILVDHDLSKHVEHVGTFTYRHAHTLIESEAEGADQ